MTKIMKILACKENFFSNNQSCNLVMPHHIQGQIICKVIFFYFHDNDQADLILSKCCISVAAWDVLNQSELER